MILFGKCPDGAAENALEAQSKACSPVQGAGQESLPRSNL